MLFRAHPLTDPSTNQRHVPSAPMRRTNHGEIWNRCLWQVDLNMKLFHRLRHRNQFFMPLRAGKYEKRGEQRVEKSLRLRSYIKYIISAFLNTLNLVEVPLFCFNIGHCTVCIFISRCEVSAYAYIIHVAMLYIHFHWNVFQAWNSKFHQNNKFNLKRLKRSHEQEHSFHLIMAIDIWCAQQLNWWSL